MKRLLIAALAVLGLTSSALAANFTCSTVAACATAPCDWDTGGSWETCNSTYPHNTGGNTYTATIDATHSVMLDGSAVNPTKIGVSGGGVPLTINGTLIWKNDNCVAGCTNGFRTIEITTTSGAANAIAIGAAGRLSMIPGSRILFDTTAGTAIVSVASGGVFDTEGRIYDTTIESVTEADADSGAGTPDETKCRVNDTIGRKWSLVVPEGAQQYAKTHRRLVFKSGQLRNRQYEIVSISGRTLVICSSYEDELSGNWECTAANAPWTCCAGADDGDVGAECTVGQRLTGHATYGDLDATFAYGHHVTPAVDPNVDKCTASTVPYACCTGAGTGTCPEINPEAGDKIALIDDVAFGEINTSSQGGYRFSGDGGGNSVAPHIYATNFASLGQTPTDNVGIAFTATAAGISTDDVSYNNFHDYNASDVIRLTGFQNYDYTWNACHDGGASAGVNAGCIIPLANTAMPLTGVDINDNVFYRYAQNALNFNSIGSTVTSDGNEIARNLVFEGCTGSSGECTAIEVNACTNCKIHNNVTFDTCMVGGTYGSAFGVGGTGGAGTGTGTAVYNNWSVNVCDKLFDGNALGDDSIYQGWVNNYGSHASSSGSEGGKWYSSILKNINLAQAASIPIMLNPYVAEGMYLLGNEVLVASSATCATDCSRYGILLKGNSAGFAAGVTATVSDVVIAGLDGTAANRGGLRWDETLDFNSNVSHITIDQRGKAGSAFSFQLTSTQTPSYTHTFTDTAYSGGNLEYYENCTTTAGAVENLGVQYILNTPYAADLGIPQTPPGLNCSSAGTFNLVGDLGYPNRLLGDYRMDPKSTLWTGAADGSAAGIRAFRFNRDAITSVWGDGIPFEGEMPANISNGTCTGLTECNQDTDGDGVMDLHDSCDRNPNPSQLDTDADGAGDACDP